MTGILKKKKKRVQEMRVPNEIQSGRGRDGVSLQRRRVRAGVSRLKESDSPECQKCESRLLRERETPRRERERERGREREREREREGERERERETERERERLQGGRGREGFICRGRRCWDGDDRGSHCWETPNNQPVTNTHTHTHTQCAIIC